ncbi:DUF982 domain-containing protein [Bosea sp. NBC_00550]|jgi:hypothetical protein|uniref:DUF982 domain-containing protein n=1 Tax=Bosea sp. NBC_00550 TaxID=2969621 RepID=UPI00222FF7D8|nr:DUF982 domain-containing protein [Bosea sp. NBC_00550]UZF93256.1 DUF982 domain-containing protein [Bosea sp. NBC_00550]
MALTPSDEFERPVVILTGLGIPTAVSSAMEAYMFLADWPKSQRDPGHAFAVKACLAAVRGEIEPETAKGLFASWAEKQDILAPDIAAFASSGRKGSHGTA